MKNGGKYKSDAFIILVSVETVIIMRKYLKVGRTDFHTFFDYPRVTRCQDSGGWFHPL